MRTTLDFSPLYRSSIGFDRVFNLLENANRVSTIDNWPPYDILRTSKADYRITIAVAGFDESELSLVQEHNLLTVAAQKAGEDVGEYLHRGIAGRAFERRFQLADHVKVTGAELKNGLLTVELKQEIPEEMKPRRIQIGTAPAVADVDVKSITSDAEKKAA